MLNPVLEALQFRRSCTMFLSNQPIPEPQLGMLLEAGRLAPSALGIEPWHFVVVTRQALKDTLRSACGNMSQVSSCSAVIVVFARIGDLEPDSEQVKAIFTRRATSEAQAKYFLNAYATLTQNLSLPSWTLAQAHMAAANIMAAAAGVEIDSCPIWQFNAAKLAALLDIDAQQYQAALPICLGYRAVAPQERFRRPLSEIVSYR